MPCLVIGKPDGSLRYVGQDSDGQYRWRAEVGERALREEPNCFVATKNFKVKASALQEQAQTTNLLNELDARLGAGGGDWLKVFFAPVAKAIGKANCMGCEVRRVITNAYGNLRLKHGKMVALILMVRLWYLSTKDVELATRKLKGYLNA